MLSQGHMGFRETFPKVLLQRPSSEGPFQAPSSTAVKLLSKIKDAGPRTSLQSYCSFDFKQSVLQAGNGTRYSGTSSRA